MKELECPYCGHEQEVDRCDGQGVEEDVVYEHQCG